MNKLRIIFMGSPEFSVRALDALVHAGHEIVTVYSQPPRPSGRGQHLHNCPVQAHAEDLNLPVLHPESFKDPAEIQVFSDLNADIAVVAAYGLILPKAVLEAPRLGCLNIHASLLPRWRGAAPIQRAILAGDVTSGIAIMQMDEGLDTGDVLMSEEIPLTDETTASILHDALSVLGARMIVEAVKGADEGTLKATPQPAEGVTYAAKLSHEESKLDWSKTASELDRAVRALNPWPGVWLMHEGVRIKVLAAQRVDQAHIELPGTILDDNLLIACKDGALRPLLLQRPGKSRMETETLLRGYSINAGSRLE